MSQSILQIKPSEILYNYVHLSSNEIARHESTRFFASTRTSLQRDSFIVCLYRGEIKHAILARGPKFTVYIHTFNYSLLHPAMHRTQPAKAKQEHLESVYQYLCTYLAPVAVCLFERFCLIFSLEIFFLQVLPAFIDTCTYVRYYQVDTSTQRKDYCLTLT